MVKTSKDAMLTPIVALPEINQLSKNVSREAIIRHVIVLAVDMYLLRRLFLIVLLFSVILVDKTRVLGYNSS